MNSLAQRFVDGYRYRKLRSQFGLNGDQSSFSVKIDGRNVDLDVDENEQAIQKHEFHKIALEDCYRLTSLCNVNNVVDIGANIGFFALACRAYFPKTTISCYEPNPEVFCRLSNNVDGLNVVTHNVAVGLERGRVHMGFKTNSLHSVAIDEVKGGTVKIPFSDIVNDIGVIDVLKLDCEGAEWKILESNIDWARIRYLTMEYHLWAKADATIDEITILVKRCGFNIEHLDPSPNGAFGMLTGTQSRH